MSTIGSSPGNEWRFLLQTTINQNSENPTTCLKFDKYEELLWCASQTGKVSSFSAANHFNRFSAFISTRMGAVNDLEITEDAVFSLSNSCLKANSRQGIPISKYSSGSMTKTTTLCRIPNSTIFLIGGEQNKILQYDFAKEKEIRTTEISENGAVIIRYNGTYCFTSDRNGLISVRNPKTLEVVNSLLCHGDRISDFDVQGNKLITCGSSQRLKATHGDPFLKVYDLRMYKAMAPVPLAFAPKFSKFMPSYCEKIVVVSQSGGVRISDLNSNGIGTNIIVDTPGITAFDFSSTKQLMAFGDFTGGVNVYSDRDTALINESSFETSFPFPLVGPPVSFTIECVATSFAIVPTPISDDDFLASDWPSELTQPMYRKSKPLGEHADKKVMHYVTQVKNPRINSKLKHFNVVPYILEDEPVPEIIEEVKVATGKANVAKIYRRKKPQPALSNRRPLPEENLQKPYNPSKHVTIESTYYMNMIVNPLVQAFYHSIPLRNVIYSHVCLEENCTACELRFLFTMMTDCSENEPIVSTNLIRSLVASGFVTDKLNILKSIKSALDNLLGAIAMVSDVLDNSLQENILSEKEKTYLKTDLNMTYRCVRCGALQTTVPAADHSIVLSYGNERAGSSPTLCQLIEKALHLGGGNANNSEERECEDCKAKSRMESKRKVKSLAPLLLIDTNSTHENFSEFWQRQLTAFERTPIRKRLDEGDSDTEKKNCRYGHECRAKKTCKFSHGRIDWEHESSLLTESVEEEGWKHYLPARIAAQVSDGIVRLTDISECPEYDEPNTEIYDLTSFVVAIGSGIYPVKWSHPVSFVKDNEQGLPWLLINEQMVCRVHENEALYMDSRWKLPLILSYRKRGYSTEGEEVERRSVIPESMFFYDENLASNEMTSSGSSDKFTLPVKDELVGMDAEFVLIRSAKYDNEKKGIGLKAIGRVSCIDSTGNRIILDDYVQVNQDEVEDYLTMYSGIVSKDLDATNSMRYLTTLKRVYLKVLILIQRGCIFVGHALHNDFSVLNMHVPGKQVIDTVKLFRLDSQRMLSLQTLSFQLLGDRIQETGRGHDSVVDSQCALKIYRKYLELKESGKLDAEIRRIYKTVAPNSPTRSAVHMSASTSVLECTK